ncbi:MAG: amylo-alpha-1,6-glucosidase [Planctomycetota bacterium]
MTSHVSQRGGPLRAQSAVGSLDAVGRPAQLELARTEWLLTTGDGGFAMGTALGANRRRFHGLFVPAARPPVRRVVGLSQLHEMLIVDASSERPIRVPLSVEDRAGRPTIEESEAAPCPPLIRFERDRSTVRWVYNAAGVELIKELRLGFRAARFAVRYSIRVESPVVLVIRPLAPLRDMGALLPEGESDRFTVVSGERGCVVRCVDPEAPAGQDPLELRLDASDGSFTEDRAWLRGCRRLFETERGAEANVDDVEDLFSPGEFRLSVKPSDGPRRLTIAGSLGPTSISPELFEKRAATTYLDATIKRALDANPGLEGCASLILAADAFIVERRHERTSFSTVIAGYPWFADWGRDTMISLPGLLLTTGRYSEARSCLTVFARHLSKGMIPNLFDEQGGEPEYNTVDAPLWFVHAVHAFVRATGEQEWYDEHMHLRCWQVLEFYQSGTRHGICMDADGLITAGDETTQLTWMDAKREGEVFTPRHGKAVEINALWHHALRCVAELCANSEPDRAARYLDLADRVAESFVDRFWDDSRCALHDCLHPVVDDDDPGEVRWTPTGEIRPNQIFAASLEHSPLDRAHQRGVIEEVTRTLRTPVGLRTLAPGSERYQPRFEGDMVARDRAYHNGTVWPWLMGPYAESLLRFGGFSDAARAEAREAIRPLVDSLPEGCLGQMCEVYDAEEPRRPQGCMAQAWSVAEVLRVAALAG